MSAHVLIAGGGIAGLTAALALGRAGVSVTVIEREGGFSEAGAGLQVSPNASSVLAQLGVLEGVARLAVRPRALAIHRWGDDRALAGMAMASADGHPFLCLRRADLQTALLDAVRLMPTITLLVGRTLRAVQADADGVTVTVTTTTGREERLLAHLLVGADGLRSAVRTCLGDNSMPRFLGYEAWRAVVRTNPIEPPAVRLWLDPDGHAVSYPMGQGCTNLVVIRNGRDHSEGWSRPGDRAVLAPLRRRAGPSLAALMEAAPEWQVWSLFDRPPAVMAKGHVVLIGDAAHPVLPFLAQGAGLAIEDAGVLAQVAAAALTSGTAQGDVLRAALARFAALRRARVARVQREARSNGRIYHAGFPVALARDLALKALGDTGMRARYGWLYDWRMGD